MDAIIRNLQIDLIMDNPNPIIEHFYGICRELSILEANVYHTGGGEFIYYNRNKEWIFFRDDEKNRFWCNYEKYWHVIEMKFNINFNEVQAITKHLFETYLDGKEVRPLVSTGVTILKIDDALNRSMSQPMNKRSSWANRVESVLYNTDILSNL